MFFSKSGQVSAWASRNNIDRLFSIEGKIRITKRNIIVTNCKKS